MHLHWRPGLPVGESCIKQRCTLLSVVFFYQLPLFPCLISLLTYGYFQRGLFVYLFLFYFPTDFVFFEVKFT